MSRILRLLVKSEVALATVAIMGMLLTACGGGGQPDAPSIGVATAGNAQASVTFTPPINDGGAAVTSYTVTSAPGNFTASGSASPITVTGLSNGTSYSFTVTATNIGGSSAPSSPSNSVIPTATVPGAPVIGIATAGNSQASVSFTPPADTGGGAISYYTVTSTPGSVTATGASSPIIVTGLNNGTTYTFTVTASNSGGKSASSGASNSVSLTGSIASMPFSGINAAGASTAYIYTPQATINTLAISGTVNVQIFTDSFYAVPDPNWLCTNNCIATTPVTAGTPLYIGVINFSTASAAFTLDVANVISSEGAIGAPKLINALPYNGIVGSVNDSFYTFTLAADTSSITVKNLTDNVDLWIFTGATFNASDPNWTCPFSLGTLTETCTAATPVLAGTTIFIRISNLITPGAAGATFTLQTP
jgi:hypothetical protein